MAVTSYKLPTTVVQNGTGVNAWADPDNILLVDGDFAVASGPASEILVGGFNVSLGQLDTITNITLKLKGYRGSFNTTLAIYAVDDTSGVEISYPYAPSFQGFDGTNTLYTLASSLFGTTWTPDQINNIKIKLVADGTLYLDSVQLAVTYTPGVTPVPVTPSSGQTVVDEFVQGIRFQLAQAMTSSDLFMFAESFTMPDGTNIEYADFHGEALITVDQGVLGSEENIRISNVEHDYNGTGLVRISIDSLNDRGLGFIYPYTTDATRRKAHGGTAEFVISNSAPFYSRFLRLNQIDALVSAPIYVEDEGVALADPVHTIDFVGAGVTVTNDGGDSFKKIVTIPGGGGGGNVESVTSSDSFIDVDNTDPDNPVLSLDTVALAADATFVGDIITSINASGDIEVVADGVTITGTGTTLDPLVAVGGSVSVLNVNVFEDFLNVSNIAEGGTGTDTNEARFLYSSIVNDSGGPSVVYSWGSETNHPGIPSISNNDPIVDGYLRIFGGNTNKGGIPLGNDFDIEMLCRCVYNVDTDEHNVEVKLNSSGDTVSFVVNADTDFNVLQWTLFTTNGTTTIPASNTWFKARWAYVSGTLTFYIDGVSIASEAGTFGANDGGFIEMKTNVTGTGTITGSMDYCKLGYTVTR